jgi:penicillin-binding protein 2
MLHPKRSREVDLDEVLLDAVNVSAFNQQRLEGKMELPLARRNLYLVAGFFSLIALGFLYQLFTLQVVAGAEYRAISENNSVREDVIVAERGVVFDRYGELVVWNEEDYEDVYEFPVRAYTDRLGMGQLLGYVSYPQKDRQGFYFRTEYVGRNGIESAFNAQLAGTNGRRLIEVDAHGDRLTEYAVESPKPGEPLTLSVDAELSEAMYQIIATSTAQSGSRSGAGAIMDVTTGEIIALTSFPSYDPEVMADGDDYELIAQYNNDDRFPFLNKVVGGAYTPGSIVKPFVAYAALVEDIISPNKTIVSTGEIVIPNPYTPSQPSIFRDWRAHGVMDMREAIAFSSNVYFYVISGGFQDQPGLGITKMSDHFARFGFGTTTGIVLANEQSGTLPTPAWKAEVFDDDWRLGDTYFTSIGQYGWQTTPLQMLVAYGALANGGKLFTPHLHKDTVGTYTDINLDPVALQVIHEGMRMTTNYPGGTARSLERNDVAIAAKSGTAELDFAKARLNTWAAGFWPYEEPRYAFIMLMENAPYSNSLGGTTVMGKVFDWMAVHRPQYLENAETNE